MDANLPLNPKGWLSHAVVQTLLGNLRAHGQLPHDVTAQPLEVALRGSSDRLVAQAYWQARPAPTILLLHGVSGSSTASYMWQAVYRGLAAKLNVVALNLRGAGEGAAVAGKMYHAGLIGDIEDTLQLLAAHANTTSLGLLGFSLGGQAALKFATQTQTPVLKRMGAMATISAPFDLSATCQRLDALPYWPFRKHILQGLTRNCRRIAAHAKLPLEVGAIGRLRSLRAFDEQVTAPMHDFASAQAYYDEASCGPHLAQLRVPTLSLHACDDPIVPLTTLLAARARAPACMQFVWTPHGGHVGFVASVRQLRQNWAIGRSIAFLSTYLA